MGYASQSALCRVCNERHGSREPHVFKDVVVHAPKVVVHKPVLVVHNEEKVVHAGSSQKDGSSRHGVYADAEKRKAYRREWMKKRRATLKG